MMHGQKNIKVTKHMCIASVNVIVDTLSILYKARGNGVAVPF